MNSLNIVTLIENNPIIKLNGDYQSKLVNKIKNSFTNTQQQLFVSSFYCYLNYDQASDFVIKLNDVWKWIGFSRIDHAKVVLEKNFKKNVDYVVENLIPEVAGAILGAKQHGGHNKEIITMTIRTFKKFCMKARTDKADEIHDYYIKLEEIINETVGEESNELKNKLMVKDNELRQEKQENIFINFNEKPVVYVGFVEENVIKFGYTNNIKQRVKTHKREINCNFTVEYVYESMYNREIEILIKEHMKENIINNKKQIELIQLDNSFGLKEVDKKIRKIKEIVEKIETDKNKTLVIDALKSKLKILEDENIKLRDENNKLMEENEELKIEVNKSENNKVVNIKTNSMLDLVDNNKKIKNAICMNFFVHHIAKQISVNERMDIVIKVLMDDLFDKYKKFRISSNFTEPIYNESLEKNILTKNYRDINGVRYILHGTDKKAYFQIHLATTIEWIRINCMIPNHFKNIFLEKDKYKTYNFRIIKEGSDNLQQIHNFLIKTMIEYTCYVDTTSKGNKIYRITKPHVKNIDISCKVLGEEYLKFIISNNYSKRITMACIYKVILTVPGIIEHRRVEFKKNRTIGIDVPIVFKWIKENLKVPNDIANLII
jgi:predicted GIY-YIG superfamily endonuclease